MKFEVLVAVKMSMLIWNLNAMWICRQTPMFWRNIVPPFSQLRTEAVCSFKHWYLPTRSDGITTEKTISATYNKHFHILNSYHF
jgi:hypothetical protein